MKASRPPAAVIVDVSNAATSVNVPTTTESPDGPGMAATSSAVSTGFGGTQAEQKPNRSPHSRSPVAVVIGPPSAPPLPPDPVAPPVPATAPPAPPSTAPPS